MWLVSKKYDVAFFQLSALLPLGLMAPYWIWGQSVVLPIYAGYVVLFGLPHNYLTWATTLPKTPRRELEIGAFAEAAVIALSICLLIPLAHGSQLEAWVRTLIVLWASWHAYRQHHGICKIYDAIQAKRTGDASLFRDRQALNLFYGLAIFAVIVWLFTFENLDFVLEKGEKFVLIHPQIPPGIYYAYLSVTAAAGVVAIKRVIWDRGRAGKFIPWPQIGLMAGTLVCNSLPYWIMPQAAMPLAVAIMSINHNVEYFGFVWLFENSRSKDLIREGSPVQLPQRLAGRGDWKSYFGLALAYSALMIGIYKIAPRPIGLTLLYFLSVVHYIVDSFVWRRNRNPSVPRVFGKIGAARDLSVPA